MDVDFFLEVKVFRTLRVVHHIPFDRTVIVLSLLRLLDFLLSAGILSLIVGALHNGMCSRYVHHSLP